ALQPLQGRAGSARRCRGAPVTGARSGNPRRMPHPPKGGGSRAIITNPLPRRRAMGDEWPFRASPAKSAFAEFIAHAALTLYHCLVMHSNLAIADAIIDLL